MRNEAGIDPNPLLAGHGRDEERVEPRDVDARGAIVPAPFVFKAPYYIAHDPNAEHSLFSHENFWKIQPYLSGIATSRNVFGVYDFMQLVFFPWLNQEGDWNFKGHYPTSVTLSVLTSAVASVPAFVLMADSSEKVEVRLEKSILPDSQRPAQLMEGAAQPHRSFYQPIKNPSKIGVSLFLGFLTASSMMYLNLVGFNKTIPELPKDEQNWQSGLWWLRNAGLGITMLMTLEAQWIMYFEKTLRLMHMIADLGRDFAFNYIFPEVKVDRQRSFKAEMKFLGSDLYDESGKLDRLLKKYKRKKAIQAREDAEGKSLFTHISEKLLSSMGYETERLGVLSSDTVAFIENFLGQNFLDQLHAVRSFEEARRLHIERSEQLEGYVASVKSVFFGSAVNTLDGVSPGGIEVPPTLFNGHVRNTGATPCRLPIYEPYENSFFYHNILNAVSLLALSSNFFGGQEFVTFFLDWAMGPRMLETVAFVAGLLSIFPLHAYNVTLMQDFSQLMSRYSFLRYFSSEKKTMICIGEEREAESVSSWKLTKGVSKELAMSVLAALSSIYYTYYSADQLEDQWGIPEAWRPEFSGLLLCVTFAVLMGTKLPVGLDKVLTPPSEKLGSFNERHTGFYVEQYHQYFKAVQNLYRQGGRKVPEPALLQAGLVEKFAADSHDTARQNITREISKLENLARELQEDPNFSLAWADRLEGLRIQLAKYAIIGFPEVMGLLILQPDLMQKLLSTNPLMGGVVGAPISLGLGYLTHSFFSATANAVQPYAAECQAAHTPVAGNQV